jgi:hypothetical protein
MSDAHGKPCSTSVGFGGVQQPEGCDVHPFPFLLPLPRGGGPVRVADSAHGTERPSISAVARWGIPIRATTVHDRQLHRFRAAGEASGGPGQGENRRARSAPCAAPMTRARGQELERRNGSRSARGSADQRGFGGDRGSAPPGRRRCRRRAERPPAPAEGGPRQRPRRALGEPARIQPQNGASRNTQSRSLNLLEGVPFGPPCEGSCGASHTRFWERQPVPNSLSET